MKKSSCSVNKRVGMALACLACASVIGLGVGGMTAQKVDAQEYEPAAIVASLGAEDKAVLFDEQAETETDANTEKQTDEASVTQGQGENESAANKTRQANQIADAISIDKGVPIWVAIVCAVGAMCAAVLTAAACISISNKQKWHR
jgi:hypothetical protein